MHILGTKNLAPKNLATKIPTTAARAACLLLAGALLVACGSATGDTPAAEAPDSVSAADQQVLTDAQQLVAQASKGLVSAKGYETVETSSIEALTEFAGPKPVAPPAEPVTLAVIGCSPAGGCLNVSREIAGIGKALGWTVTEAAGNGTPTSYQQLFDTAITQGVDAIVGIAVPGVLVQAQLAKAQERGIVTIATNSSPVGGPGYTGYVDAREPLQKTVLASWIIAESQASAKVVFADAQGNPDLGVPAGTAAMERCEGCSVTKFSAPIPDFLNPVTVTAKTQAMVQANPDADYLVWPTGGLPLQPAVQALARSGRAGEVAIVASDLDPASAPLLRNGELAALTVVSFQWVALATVDAANRGLAGQPIPQSDEWGIGVALVDKDAAPAAEDYAGIDAVVRERLDYVAPFADAWGVPLGVS